MQRVLHATQITVPSASLRGKLDVKELRTIWMQVYDFLRLYNNDEATDLPTS